MNSLKKKLLAGLLSGAIIFTGGLALNNVQAAEPSENQQQQEFQRHERRQMSNEQISEFAKKIAEKYGINQSEIEDSFKNRIHFEDIQHAAILSKLSGKSFSEVLAMKTDWQQVAEKLGVSREQIKNLLESEMIEGLAERSKLDAKTVESLLKEKYRPQDITVAGLIADASGKKVKDVLAKRKINNSWEDVAKEFNVDLSKFRNFERGGDRHGHGFNKGRK